jgi:Asp-tRNA(Asn)/Glu-tRNA(Gln) amidotransferase A subunit family amidase
LLRQFIDWLERGERTAEDVLRLCLDRIARAEPDVRAWVEVAPRAVRKEGRLRGIPFGAKDIIETRGMATEYGSPLYAGRRGECDAAVITMLEEAGAVLLGKTHTTAFASFDPAPTRNPRLAGHTPGGSSSGSAAAVAAGMAPFAIGTQTLGSVLRPASYCGVCGFKPTYGLIATGGVLPCAPSQDTLGFFTQTAADMQCLWSRMRGRVVEAQPARVARFPEDAPEGWDRLTAAAFRINDYECARTHQARYQVFGKRIGSRLAELVRRGLEISEGEYEEARAHVAAMRGVMSQFFEEYPIVESAAATGPAPAGFESTGDPSANAPWTALGVPAISVPVAGDGPPLGRQLAAAWGRDDELVAFAAGTEMRLAAVR